MEIQTKKTRIILVIEAIWMSKKLSQCFVVKIYKVLFSTLFDKMAGRTYCPETKANGFKLIELKEEVICRNILELDSRGFAPWFASVEDMANYIFEL